MPRKMRRQALRSALSALAADQQIVVVDELAMDAPKTQAMRDTLRQLVGKHCPGAGGGPQRAGGTQHS